MLIPAIFVSTGRKVHLLLVASAAESLRNKTEEGAVKASPGVAIYVADGGPSGLNVSAKTPTAQKEVLVQKDSVPLRLDAQPTFTLSEGNVMMHGAGLIHLSY